MQIALESPEQPDVVQLIARLDEYQSGLYPAESNHLLDLASLKQPHVLFAVARDNAGLALGCGAVVLQRDFSELKRMFVLPGLRGRGIGNAILGFLEAAAIQRGSALLMLETGIRQVEALRLYERAGFQRCGPFGDYADDPLSVFMRKKVSG
ncbi:MAG: GNAT family N-acetyltransferase [Nevskia sp.]|nr:GNAT family N-acetyltransferase [Nevskia sp.]